MTSDADSFTRGVSNVILYSTWHNKPGIMGDIALLKLQKPVTYSKIVSPVCLPWDMTENTFADTVGLTIGWGKTEDGNISDYLRKV